MRENQDKLDGVGGPNHGVKRAVDGGEFVLVGVQGAGPLAAQFGDLDMKIKTFTLRLDPESGVFDDAELCEFQQKYIISSAQEHMLTYHGEPLWVFSLRYEEPQRYPAKRGRKTRKDLRAELNLDEQRCFDLLDSWREQKSRQEGKPPFIYLSNQQLFDLVKRRPKSLVDLSNIRGLGPSKIKDFGLRILEILQQPGALNQPKSEVDKADQDEQRA